MVTPTEAQREDYEERAAILEFEANLSRPEAERLAALMCFPRPRTQGELFVPTDLPNVPIPTMHPTSRWSEDAITGTEVEHVDTVFVTRDSP